MNHERKNSVWKLPGLESEAEILVDRWGVPHIYAQTKADLFLAQGFNAARDRLWQIDLWRKRGLGELARDLGPSYVETDRACRLFLYRGDMEAEWSAYGGDAKMIVASFVAGINAYVGLTRGRPELLPPEFGILGYKPALWQAEDVVRIRIHNRGKNLVSEMARAQVATAAGIGCDAIRQRLEPAPPTPISGGSPVEDVPPEVLRLYNLAHEPPVFAPGNGSETGCKPPEFASNNFTVAPARSATGRPIFASDPHRVQGVPSLRYWAHLSSPGIDVIGMGEPFVPGVSLGHNADIAFGLTTFAIDQEDLYVYATNPANPDEYLYQGRWEPMTVRKESFEIRNSVSAVLELRFTRHGPVLFEDKANHRAYAVRMASLEPGMVPYLSSLRYMRARNGEEFLAGLSQHGMPPLNFLFADTAGNIGWAPRGRTPIRPNWDGLLPVPGDGRYEWAGFRTMDELPCIINPPEGWLGTSNEMNLPASHAEMKIGFEWSDSSRMLRQRQIFTGKDKFEVEDLVKAQTDVTTVAGQRLTKVLRVLRCPADPRLAAAYRTLTEWDHRSDRRSAGAAVFNVWFHKHLRFAVVRRLVPEKAWPLIGPGDAPAILELMEKPDGRLGPDPETARNTLLMSSLAAAVTELERTLGADMAHWSWGRLHFAWFTHPLSPVLSPGQRAQFDIGPIPKGGDNETLARSEWQLSDFRLLTGASARFVADVGNWNSSWACNSPGQSGDPRSPHYRDLFEDWSNDRYFPLLFGRQEIEAATEERILLIPGN